VSAFGPAPSQNSVARGQNILVISRFRLPQFFTEVFDCDKKGYHNRPDDRHGYNGIGRQTGTAEALAQDVRDEASQANGPEDDKGGTMSGSWMIRQWFTYFRSG
jgi:hypothetical protein